MSYLLGKLEGRERRSECRKHDEELQASVRTDRAIVPYKAGKVQIGLRYMPSLPRVEGDAAAIQRALLDPRTADPASLPRRFLGFLWGWC